MTVFVKLPVILSKVHMIVCEVLFIRIICFMLASVLLCLVNFVLHQCSWSTEVPSISISSSVTLIQVFVGLLSYVFVQMLYLLSQRITYLDVYFNS